MATRAGMRIGRMVSRAVGQERLEIPAGGGRQLRGSTSSTKRLALFYNTLDKPRRDNLTQVGVENAIAAEAAAGTLTWSEAQKNGCFNHRSGKDDQQLAFMRDYLYAFSFLPGNDAVLLRHWLNHYTVGTGVRPDHLAFATTASQARGDGWAEHVAVLRRAGVAARQVEIVNDTYSDGLKLSVINAHIASLPLDAWLLVADHDELVRFSCELRHRLPQIVCGHMTDMLALGGSIAPLRPTPDISVQFPLACSIRNALGNPYSVAQRFMTDKPTLFKAWISTAGRTVKNASDGTAASWVPRSLREWRRLPHST